MTFSSTIAFTEFDIFTMAPRAEKLAIKARLAVDPGTYSGDAPFEQAHIYRLSLWSEPCPDQKVKDGLLHQFQKLQMCNAPNKSVSYADRFPIQPAGNTFLGNRHQLCLPLSVLWLARPCGGPVGLALRAELIHEATDTPVAVSQSPIAVLNFESNYA